MNDDTYMQRCLDLALLGQNLVSSNPMVGAVLVLNNQIIAEGYHQFFGGPHAEINCFNNIPPQYRQPHILQNATLYINLEPCCHFGKTPPCTNAIIQHGIKKVVIGMQDINPIVASNGIKILQQNNIHVKIGVLSQACQELNKRFITYHQKKRPYIILKWATCLNNYTAQKNFQAVTISNQYTNFITHQWRSQETAILAGFNTIFHDNPQLTTRHAQGKSPTRIIIDKNLQIPTSHNIFKNNAKTIIFNQKTATSNNHLSYIQINFNQPLIPQITTHLYQQNILSLIVEGGPKTLQQFINNNTWDEARIIKNSRIAIQKGIPSPSLTNNHLTQIKNVFSDQIYYYNQK